jgi:hypothetical protein
VPKGSPFRRGTRAVARATGRDVRLFRPPYSSTPATADAGSLAVLAEAAHITATVESLVATG